MEKPIPVIYLWDKPFDVVFRKTRTDTIAGRQEFTGTGIKCLDDADIRIKSKNALINSYSLLLESYAVFRQETMDSDIMRYVETALLNILDLGFADCCHDQLLVAISGVIGELSMAEVSRLQTQRLTNEELLGLWNESIQISVNWLIKNPWKSLKYSERSANRVIQWHLTRLSESIKSMRK